MYQADTEIKNCRQVKLPVRSYLICFAQKLQQEIQDSQRHPHGHGLHQPQRLADLVVGHTGHQKHDRT